MIERGPLNVDHQVARLHAAALGIADEAGGRSSFLDGEEVVDQASLYRVASSLEVQAFDACPDNQIGRKNQLAVLGVNYALRAEQHAVAVRFGARALVELGANGFLGTERKIRGMIREAAGSLSTIALHREAEAEMAATDMARAQNDFVGARKHSFIGAIFEELAFGRVPENGIKTKNIIGASMAAMYRNAGQPEHALRAAAMVRDSLGENLDGFFDWELGLIEKQARAKLASER